MNKQIYLYIFEDMTMKQTDKVPSKEDLESVEMGYLDIVTIDPFKGQFIHLPSGVTINDL